MLQRAGSKWQPGKHSPTLLTVSKVICHSHSLTSLSTWISLGECIHIKTRTDVLISDIVRKGFCSKVVNDFVTSSWWQIVEATTQQRNGGFCAFGLCGLLWLLTATNEAHSGVLLQHWLTAWVMASSSYQYVTLVMSPFLYQLHLLLSNMLHLIKHLSDACLCRQKQRDLTEVKFSKFSTKQYFLSSLFFCPATFPRVMSFMSFE